MLIVQAVEHIAAVLAEPYQTTGSKQFELLTDGALLHAQFFTDCIHSPLSLLEEEEDFKAGGIAEDFEEIGNIDDFLFQGENYLF